MSNRKLPALYAFAVLIAGLTFGSEGIKAQYFPTFGTSYASTLPGGGATPEGVAVTAVPASTATSELLAVFNSGGIPVLANSLDGITWSSSVHLPTVEYCDATPHMGRCTPSITNYNGTPFIALWDTANELEIWTESLVGGGNNSYASPVQKALINVGNGGMHGSPQITVFNGRIVIIYPVASINGITNALQETYSDDGGTTWTTTSAYLGSLTFAAPTQVGLAQLNGTLWMTTQQNNSTRHLLYWSSTDGLIWQGYAINSLYVDSGMSMVPFNNNLVMATKQNNNQEHLFLFSSPNGSTWYAQQENELVEENTTPALTLFNGGIELVYLDHSGNGYFYSTFASY